MQELSKFKILGFTHAEALATPAVSHTIYLDKQGTKGNDLEWASDSGAVVGIHVKPKGGVRQFIVPIGLISQIEVEPISAPAQAAKKLA